MGLGLLRRRIVLLGPQEEVLSPFLVAKMGVNPQLTFPGVLLIYSIIYWSQIRIDGIMHNH